MKIVWMMVVDYLKKSKTKINVFFKEISSLLMPLGSRDHSIWSFLAFDFPKLDFFWQILGHKTKALKKLGQFF